MEFRKEVLPPREALPDPEDLLEADLRERAATARVRIFWGFAVLTCVAYAAMRFFLVWS